MSRPLPSALLTLALLPGCTRTPPPVMPYDLNQGVDVVRAMHDRYVTRWFDNVTYVQEMEELRGGAPDTTVWLVGYDSPGRLRIDFEPRARGNGLLIVRDTQYTIAAGRAAPPLRAVDPLLLWQHEVYVLTPPETVARLRELNFDLNAVRQEIWQGRPAIVLGRGTRESWIDRETMLLVRLIAPRPLSPSAVQEYRLREYVRIGSAWLPRQIEVHTGGQPEARWRLSQVRANSQLDSLLFVPGEWMRARHWYQSPVLRERR